ncbi:TonB-dependent receptor [Ferruginibacter sp. SUN106]|uniref:TonB-dependent receptor n=1 Tax=Ferruginibacter sp. SUN106 TaxID=2978348 RepID=UPI003D365794
MRLKFLLTLFLASALSFAFAQETTSEIQGIVTDGSNGLGNATIVAVHNPTGTKYSTTSRRDGRYNLPNLRVGGPYTITVSFVGFKAEQQDNITLLLGQAYKADFKLASTSSTLGEVVVATKRQDKIFSNNRTGSQEVINRTQIERLPTISRSLQDFTKLEPTSNGLSFGGRSNQYNNVTVDGANFNNSFGLSGTLGGQTGSQPISLDAIEQIQVNVSPYDIRQGGFTGAGINTVTRSGTNQIRGTVYTYLKNENNQGYKVANTQLTKTPITFNLRGFSVGGAIIKNKVFFFVSAEQVRQELPATSYIASDASHPPVNGSVSQANADTLAKLASFLQTKFGYTAGPFQGYNQKTQSDKITAKIDWNINDKNTLTLKYNYLKSSADQFASTSRNGFSGFVTGGQPGFNSMPFQGSGYVINNNFNIFIAELNTRFSNKIVNKFQVGFTQLRDFRSTQGNSDLPLVDILSGGNIYTTFGYEPFTYNNKLNTDNFQFSDILTFYKGSHEITAGTQNSFKKYLNGFAPAYQGAYQFSSLTEFYNSVNDPTGNSKALRYAVQYSALKDGSFPYAKAGSNDISLFVQDKWSVKKNFTLTYGIRFDNSSYTGSFDQNPDFAALTFANGATYDVGRKPKSALLVSPRLGLNWDVLGDKSLQVRGGGGIFSGPPPFVWISNQASNNGVQFGSVIKTGATAVAFNADPNANKPTAGAANTAYSVALVDNKFKYPSVVKTSLAIDKKLKHDWVLTLEGTYTKDINAVYYSNVNLNETAAFALAGADNRLRYNTSTTTTLNNSSKYYFAGTSAANPNLGNAILMKNSSKGYSSTTTFRVQKTIKSLYLSAAYTHSKSKNTAEGGSTAGSLWSGRAVSGTDPNEANLSNASWYQPHRVVAFASYKFNYAKYFATSFGLYFEAAPNGVTSYIYNGDLNGDGNNNDLIFIPAAANQINLVKSGSGGLGTGTSTDTRTAAQQWAQLNAFISQDNYLSAHRGEVAKANSVILPYFKKLDVNITQDISLKTGKGANGDRHTLRLSLDILNVGNLLNKYWGLVKSPTVTNFLRYEGLGADGKTPSFSFTQQDAANLTPYVNSFANSTSIASRWQMQFGIRYLFN